MTRRTFIAAATAAAIAVPTTATAAQPRKADGWITIAHPGENLNRRIYSEKALDQMCRGMFGRLVFRPAEHPEEIASLDAVLGIVIQSRRLPAGEVQVKVLWHRECETKTCYLTPNGQGVKYVIDGDTLTVSDYMPESLTLSDYTGFERATEL